MSTRPPAPAAGWWSLSEAALLRALHADADGLTRRQAALRRRRHGANLAAPETRRHWTRALAARLMNPLIAVLMVASLVSALTGDVLGFGLIAVIVASSTVLDLWQERRAGHAVEALRDSVALTAHAWRDGVAVELPAEQLVPGDLVDLAAGDLLPADGRVLAATDFFVDQAALTGESAPVEKHAHRGAAADVHDPLGCTHAAFAGSSVVGGSARMLVCATGMATQFGRLAQLLVRPAPPTAFERGIHRFGLMLTRTTLALVLFVLLVNAVFQRPLLDSFLFAVALAVGLTPELLPMIVSVTLARSAVRMSREGVIVKRLTSVQDLGAMDVLCTDKTGTLTEAHPRVERALGPDGQDDARVFELAWLNAHFETGLRSPLDRAILAHRDLEADGWRKLDEVPFDFVRRRVSVLLERAGTRSLIAKGAPEDILRLSTFVATPAGPQPLDGATRQRLSTLFDAQAAQGLRLLAVASRDLPPQTSGDVGAEDERDFVFAGCIAFADPPKPSTATALAALAARGVAVKIVTGDHEAVARHLCEALHIPVAGVLTGAQIALMDDAALGPAADRTMLFCRVTPEQKNRIVRALQARGHVVGYLGDGINDAPPLHSADVGISVDGAVDVARQAADLVLLRHDLGVLHEGILEGRRAFLNVDKYVLMATSSNFGNMLSMAGAALFLPFLPMKPVQVLLNNLLYDVSELAIPADRVDDADLAGPRRWDSDRVRRAMLTFGPLSSAFDLLAFGLLLGVLHVAEAEFQSAWFVLSLATQVLVIFVLRTARPCWRDRPSPALALTSVATVAFAAALPWLPGASLFGLVPLPPAVLATLGALTFAYLVATETARLAGSSTPAGWRSGREGPTL